MRKLAPHVWCKSSKTVWSKAFTPLFSVFDFQLCLQQGSTAPPPSQPEGLLENPALGFLHQIWRVRLKDSTVTEPASTKVSLRICPPAVKAWPLILRLGTIKHFLQYKYPWLRCYRYRRSPGTDLEFRPKPPWIQVPQAVRTLG